MAKFNSVEEAVAVHKKYRIDTEEEGKYLTSPGNHNLNRVKWISSQVPEESYVLEVGCNSGGLCNWVMRERACFAVGIDVNPSLTLKARLKGVSAYEARAEEIPCKSNTFDVVIITEVLEHLYDPELALKEIYRVLKNGGLIIGSVPHISSLNSNKVPIEEHEYHCHIFNMFELDEKLSKYFKDVTFCDIKFYNHHIQEPQWLCFKGVKSVSKPS